MWDVDLEFMARRFEIAGGNIRNIALAAAYLTESLRYSASVTRKARSSVMPSES
jgi:hypothetical protein